MKKAPDVIFAIARTIGGVTGLTERFKQMAGFL
jgi:hypothetical protein